MPPPRPPRATVRKRSIVEYTDTEGTGPYTLNGAAPSGATARSRLRDGALVQYRVTSRDGQEIGRGRFEYANNRLIRQNIYGPNPVPRDWGRGRKLLFILDS